MAVLFGGRSAEHEVSPQSARNVIDAIDKGRYNTVLIGIDRKGDWFLNDNSMALLRSDNPQLIALNQSNIAVSPVPGDEQTDRRTYRTRLQTPLSMSSSRFCMAHMVKIVRFRV